MLGGIGSSSSRTNPRFGPCDHIETTTQTRLGCNTEQTAVVLLASKIRLT